MYHIIRLRKYTKLRIHNQIQVKDFKEIETLTINQQINLANHCGAKRYFRLRGFSIAGASAPVAPAVPTPMVLTTRAPLYNRFRTCPPFRP